MCSQKLFVTTHTSTCQNCRPNSSELLNYAVDRPSQILAFAHFKVCCFLFCSFVQPVFAIEHSEYFGYFVPDTISQRVFYARKLRCSKKSINGSTNVSIISKNSFSGDPQIF